MDYVGGKGGSLLTPFEECGDSYVMYLCGRSGDILKISFLNYANGEGKGCMS